MLADDIKIVKITEQRTYDATYQASVAMRVEFLVGRHGPFVVKIPQDDYSAQVRDDKLNAFAVEVRT